MGSKERHEERERKGREEKMLCGKNLEIMAMRAGRLELRAASHIVRRLSAK